MDLFSFLSTKEPPGGGMEDHGITQSLISPSKALNISLSFDSHLILLSAHLSLVP